MIPILTMIFPMGGSSTSYRTIDVLVQSVIFHPSISVTNSSLDHLPMMCLQWLIAPWVFMKVFAGFGWQTLKAERVPFRLGLF